MSWPVTTRGRTFTHCQYTKREELPLNALLESIITMMDYVRMLSKSRAASIETPSTRPSLYVINFLVVFMNLDLHLHVHYYTVTVPKLIINRIILAIMWFTT